MKQKRATMTQWGKGQWRVTSWDDASQAWVESSSMSWRMARAIVGRTNCRNPKTCTLISHDHREG